MTEIREKNIQITPSFSNEKNKEEVQTAHVIQLFGKLYEHFPSEEIPTDFLKEIIDLSKQPPISSLTNRLLTKYFDMKN